MQMVSNMHIIPANPEIAQQIKQVKRGDLVQLKGELVEIRDKDLVWLSSLHLRIRVMVLVSYSVLIQFSG